MINTQEKIFNMYKLIKNTDRKMLFIAFWKVLNKKPYAILNLRRRRVAAAANGLGVIVSFDPSHLLF